MNLDKVNISKRIFILFTALTLLLLGLGYSIDELWIPTIFLIVQPIFLFFVFKNNWKWGISVFLASNTIFAAGGIIAGVPSILMIAGVASSLIAWELAHPDVYFSEMHPHPQSIIHEIKRIKLLLISCGLGFIISGIVFFLQFEIPFYIIFSLVIIILLCFYQIARMLEVSN